MAYTFETTKDYKVIVKLNGEQIDEVGAFESEASASYWATEVAKKYLENPTYVYPGEEPEVDASIS